MLELSHAVLKPFKSLKALKVSLNNSGHCPSLSTAHCSTVHTYKPVYEAIVQKWKTKA